MTVVATIPKHDPDPTLTGHDHPLDEIEVEDCVACWEERVERLAIENDKLKQANKGFIMALRGIKRDLTGASPEREKHALIWVDNTLKKWGTKLLGTWVTHVGGPDVVVARLEKDPDGGHSFNWGGGWGTGSGINEAPARSAAWFLKSVKGLADRLKDVTPEEMLKLLLNKTDEVDGDSQGPRDGND